MLRTRWASPSSRLYGGYSGGRYRLNYASEYRDVDGIIVPTKRRIYAYEGDYQLVPEPLLVKIDMGEITIK
jgi:hypothetical protein